MQTIDGGIEMNYMEQVAKMLGVELGEKFKIRFESGNVSNDLYIFTHEGLCITGIVTNLYDIFPRLFTGEIEIVKLPLNLNTHKSGDASLCFVNDIKISYDN